MGHGFSAGSSSFRTLFSLFVSLPSSSCIPGFTVVDILIQRERRWPGFEVGLYIVQGREKNETQTGTDSGCVNLIMPGIGDVVAAVERDR